MPMPAMPSISRLVAMGRRMNSSETFIHRWDHAAARAHVVFPLVLQNFMFMERCNGQAIIRDTRLTRVPPAR